MYLEMDSGHLENGMDSGHLIDARRHLEMDSGQWAPGDEFYTPGNEF